AQGAPSGDVRWTERQAARGKSGSAFLSPISGKPEIEGKRQRFPRESYPQSLMGIGFTLQTDREAFRLERSDPWAVRWEPARRAAQKCAVSQARPGVSGKCQGAPAGMPRWSAGWRTCLARHVHAARREMNRALLGAPSP